MKTRVIVAALVTRGDKFLCGRKPTGIGPYPDTWHIPGGGVKLGEEDADDAMRREIKEEAGIGVKNLRKIAWDIDITKNKFGEDMRFIFLQYQCDYDKGTLKAGDDLEHLEWISHKDLPRYKLNKPTRTLLSKLGII